MDLTEKEILEKLDSGEIRIFENVPLKETLRGFRAILNGECDDLPESAFLFAGTIEEVREKAAK